MSIYVQYNSQAHSDSCCCKYDGKQGKNLSAIMEFVVFSESYKIKDSRIDHQLNTDKDHDGIPFGKYSIEPYAEYAGADDQKMCQSNHLSSSFRDSCEAPMSAINRKIEITSKGRIYCVMNFIPN